ISRSDSSLGRPPAAGRFRKGATTCESQAVCDSRRWLRCWPATGDRARPCLRTGWRANEQASEDFVAVRVSLRSSSRRACRALTELGRRRRRAKIWKTRSLVLPKSASRPVGPGRRAQMKKTRHKITQKSSNSLALSGRAGLNPAGRQLVCDKRRPASESASERASERAELGIWLRSFAEVSARVALGGGTKFCPAAAAAAVSFIWINLGRGSLSAEPSNYWTRAKTGRDERVALDLATSNSIGLIGGPPATGKSREEFASVCVWLG
ncbi:Hypothetical predicted protein, partial [Olea europaea subsp. europaea]